MSFLDLLQSVVVFGVVVWCDVSYRRSLRRHQRLERIREEATRTYKLLLIARLTGNRTGFELHCARHQELSELHEEECRK
jgi:hypothetical protein